MKRTLLIVMLLMLQLRAVAQTPSIRGTVLEVPAKDSTTAFDQASKDFQFGASVAAFGMVLRDSPHKGTVTIEDVLKSASASMGTDPARSEFVELARRRL